MRLRLALLLGLAATGCAAPTAPRAPDDIVSSRERGEALLAEGDSRLDAALRSSGSIEPAVRAYQEALRCDPFLAAAHLRLARCYYLTQEHDLEQSEYAKCLALSPNSVQAWERLGHSRLALDDLQGARLAYDRVLALDPFHEAVLFNLHLVELDLGNTSRANELLLRVQVITRERRPHLVTPD
jgi:tetratricopeptide (TPR) repeat protein